METEVGWRAGRRVDRRRKKCAWLVRCHARNIFGQEIKNRRRMPGCLGCYKLVAAGHGSLAAVVGIRPGALALLAAIRRLLIEFSTSEAVERTN